MGKQKVIRSFMKFFVETAPIQRIKLPSPHRRRQFELLQQQFPLFRIIRIHQELIWNPLF